MEFDNNILLESLRTGLINKNIESEIAYQPKIITNDYRNNEKVLTSIDSLLQECEEFFFNVAFVTKSGVISLLNTLEKIEKQGKKGKILSKKIFYMEIDLT